MKEKFSEMLEDENKVIHYTTDDGKSRVSYDTRWMCLNMQHRRRRT
jgi:hypothetical protein